MKINGSNDWNKDPEKYKLTKDCKNTILIKICLMIRHLEIHKKRIFM